MKYLPALILAGVAIAIGVMYVTGDLDKALEVLTPAERAAVKSF